MAIKRMPAALLAQELGAAYERKDGYIMGATGQNPRKWPADSHWFTQYSGAQREKALYWRADVKELQADLIRLGYDCGRWGADGDFGDATELAVKAFQRDHRLDADGVCGPRTCAALEKALAKLETRPNAPRLVEIVGGNCYVRDAPSTSGKKLGVAHAGDRLTWLGEIDEATRWLKVDYLGRAGWVSGKYAKLV